MKAGYKPMTTVKKGEKVLGWLLLAAAILCCRAFPFHLHSLGAFAALTVLAALSTVLSFLYSRDGRGKRKAIFGFLLAELAALPILTQSGILFPLTAAVFSPVLLLYHQASASGLASGNGNLFWDGLKSVFVLPFAGFTGLPVTLFFRDEEKKGRSAGKTVLAILLGILLALLPAGIVIALLSYDKGFRSLLSFPDITAGTVAAWVAAFLFGIPAAMLLYGSFACAARERGAGWLDASFAKKLGEKLRRLPAISAFVATLPLLLIYALFFFSQREYYLAAFIGRLPDGLSYADYAREGFFQLLGVALLNAVLLLLMQLFTKKKGDRRGASETVATLLLSLATLLLIATAVAKLILYMRSYGLTEKRLCAGWLLLLLAACFLVVLLSLCIRKMKLFPALFAVFCLFWGMLSLYDWRGFIADYNTNGYLDGEIERIDVNYLASLKESGVPALVKLAEEREDQRGDVRDALRQNGLCAAVEQESGTPLLSENFPRLRAARALRELVAEQPEFFTEENHYEYRYESMS